jgi:methyl-accepting chemotaxis protein
MRKLAERSKSRTKEISHLTQVVHRDANDLIQAMERVAADVEKALRLTAEHVDHKLQDYMQVKHIVGPWKSGERLMVAVSASPFS